MVVVYTNSKERAMRIAAGFDGIILSSSVKVHLDTLDQYREDVEAVLDSGKAICAYFMGVSYYILFTNGIPARPYKMAEYENGKYADLANRPACFELSALSFRITCPVLEENLDYYKSLCKQATRIINAASDDYEGNLSFLLFLNAMGRAEATNIAKATPVFMLPRNVTESFSTIHSYEATRNALSAVEMHNRLDWLVTCNASNQLSRLNPQRKMIVTGRWESAALDFLALREAERLRSAKNSTATVQVTLRTPDKKTVVETTMAIPASSASMAEKAGAKLKKGDAFRLEVLNCDEHQHHKKLYNLFTLLDACSAAGLSRQEACDAIDWLYYHGYISWPSTCTEVPWALKGQLARSIAALGKLPRYQGTVQPRDVDAFSDWVPGIPANASGIVISDKTPEDSLLSPACQTVYDLLAKSVISTIKTKVLETHLQMEFIHMVNDYRLTADLHTVTDLSAAEADTSSLSGCHEGDIFSVEDVRVVPCDIPPLYTEETLKADLLAAIGSGHNNSRHLLNTAIKNLLDWSNVSRSHDGTLSISAQGQLTHRYLSYTILSDPDAIFNWDRRLQLVHDCKSNSERLNSDIFKYLHDISNETASICAQVADAQGSFPDEGTKCPLCSGDFAQAPDGRWKCADCGFSIPKAFSGHEITKADINGLLTYGITPLVEMFSTKNNSNFQGRLTIENGRLKPTFRSPYFCPACGSPLNENGNSVKCTSADCPFSFVLYKNFMGHTFSQSDIEKLLAMKRTPVLTLTKRTGAKLRAAVRLDENMKLTLLFAPRTFVDEAKLKEPGED